ncbi:hypothetical protein [Maribacter sp. 2210JD10-5]|uniref:hypothetical protein n=1 Tax=Maribacter sp. 2210JD10-5 TaxID=3386272 RepID=UPI0039BC80B5
MLCFAVTAIHGQETERFQGSMQIGAYQGEADYTYKIVDGDTLLNGPFELRKSSLEALIQEEDNSFLFKGNFKEDYPSGRWRFEFGDFKSNNQTEVVDYQYRVLINGIQEEAEGIITKGKPDGPWTYIVNKITDSEIEETIFKSEFDFDEGVPQKNFSIEDENNTLIGRFLRDGLAHDEWSLFKKNVIGDSENWYFTEGLLNKIVIEKDGETKTFSVFKKDAATYETLNLDNQYIELLTLELSEDGVSFKDDVEDLLALNISYYQKIDSILSALGKAQFLPRFQVKAPYFPLDTTEIRQLDTIAVNLKIAKDVSESLLNDTQLAILKLSEQDAAYYYAVTDSISNQFVKPLTRMAGFHKSGILEFISPENLSKILWPNEKPSTEITVRMDSVSNTKKYHLKNAEHLDFNGDDFTSLTQMANYARLSLEDIEETLSKRLTRERKLQELVTLEEQLISKSKSLNQYIDSLKTEVPPKFKNAVQSIAAYANQQLSDYSNIEETGQKFSRAKGLVTCFSSLDKLSKTVAQLPNSSMEIQDKYTDRIWNPFMATLMDEEVKKRIVSAYKKTLVPYFLDQVTTNLNCERSEKINLLIQNTNQRMLELREMDTKKLERKLKRTQNPETVLELFNLANQKQP